MTVDVTIAEGEFSIPFIHRALLTQIWVKPLRQPKAFHISNLLQQFSRNGVPIRREDIPAEIARKVRIEKNLVLSSDYTQWPEDAKIMYQDWLYQENKIGGIAVGSPVWSDKYHSEIHPNSLRLTSDFSGEYAEYEYVNGIRIQDEAKVIDGHYQSHFLQEGFFMYLLHPYAGGTYPAPCDWRVRYDIDFVY